MSKLLRPPSKWCWRFLDEGQIRGKGGMGVGLRKNQKREVICEGVVFPKMGGGLENFGVQ